jgi:hypothetical protein
MPQPDVCLTLAFLECVHHTGDPRRQPRLDAVAQQSRLP